MWNNTRELIQNSFNNFNQIFRRDRSNSSIDLDFRRRTIRRARRTNRTNCLSRSSTRASTINSQLNRELLSSSNHNSNQNHSFIRPPHVRHSSRSSHSSNLSSPSSTAQQTCFTPLPTTINSTYPSLPNSNQVTSQLPAARSLSPILVTDSPYSSRYPIISCPQYANVFSQHYLRSISRSFYNLAGEHQNLLNLTKEKNYLSCLINLLTIITIVIAIIQPKWFSIVGGTCNNKYIGLQEFMYVQNTPISVKNPFLSFINEHKAYTTMISTTSSAPLNQQQQHTVNYFKLTEQNSTIENHKSNLTNDSKIEKNKTNRTISKIIDAVQPIHLPVSPPNQLANQIEKHKNLPFKNSYEKIIKKSNEEPTSQIQFYKSSADHYQNNQLNDCLSPEVISLQRIIVILCFFVIFSSLIQLLLDLISTNNKYIHLLREHAIFNITSVIICIMIIGVSYLLSNLLTKEQIQKNLLINQRQLYNNHYLDLNKNKFHSPSINYFNLDKDDNQIEIRLELSYYLVIFAGIFSLVAAFLECLFNKPNLYLININSDQETSHPLLSSSDDSGYWSHFFNVNNPNFRNLINFYPPPAYSEN